MGKIASETYHWKQMALELLQNWLKTY